MNIGIIIAMCLLVLILIFLKLKRICDLLALNLNNRDSNHLVLRKIILQINNNKKKLDN
jgi:hypothetical protein